MPTRHRQPAFATFALALGVGGTARAAEPPAFAVPKDASGLLATFCNDCHGASASGSVRLDDMAALKTVDRLDLLNKVQDQLFFRMIPLPKAAEPARRTRRRWPPFALSTPTRNRSSPSTKHGVVAPSNVPSLKTVIA